MVSPDLLRDLPHGTVLHHVSRLGFDHQPVRCRTSGRLREWKRDPDCWEQLVKHGLRDSFLITPRNAHEWVLPSNVT